MIRQGSRKLRGRRASREGSRQAAQAGKGRRKRTRNVSRWLWAAAIGLGVACSPIGYLGFVRSPGFASAQAQSAAQTAPRSSPATSATGQPTADREFLARNCVGCHNQRLKTAGLALDDTD